jgi:tetratricopeptide (TPR) repeat protein
MFKRKKKKELRYKKAGIWGSIKGTLRDIGSLFNFLSNEQVRKKTGQSIKSTQKDLWKGLGFLGSKRVLWPLILIALVVAGAYAAIYFLDKDRQSKAYLADANASLQAESFENAIASFEKVFELSKSGEPSTHLNYVQALLGHGDKEMTQKAVAKYAPEAGNVPGIKEVHRLVAFGLAQQPKGRVDLKRLKWHLDCSGEIDSIEMNVAWARYHLAVGNSRSALQCFQNAARINPLYFDQVISLYGSSGQKDLQAAAMRDAKPKLQDALKATPKNERCRLLLSKILYQERDYGSCEQLLLQGLQLTDSPAMKDAVASFKMEEYLRGDAPKSYEETLKMVDESLKLSPYNVLLPRVLEKVVASETQDEKGQLFELLEKATEVESTAMTAHDMLSIFYWKEKQTERAIEHAKVLYEMTPDSSVANNNLAFLLGEIEGGDLDRALELSRKAVAINPQSGSFRDTLGTILMKMEQYEEATIELKKALLQNVDDKAAVHKKLANSYDKMGLTELAKKHSEN